jgi:hypothetical protein
MTADHPIHPRTYGGITFACEIQSNQILFEDVGTLWFYIGSAAARLQPREIAYRRLNNRSMGLLWPSACARHF